MAKMILFEVKTGPRVCLDTISCHSGKVCEQDPKSLSGLYLEGVVFLGTMTKILANETLKSIDSSCQRPPPARRNQWNPCSSTRMTIQGWKEVVGSQYAACRLDTVDICRV